MEELVNTVNQLQEEFWEKFSFGALVWQIILTKRLRNSYTMSFGDPANPYQRTYLSKNVPVFQHDCSKLFSDYSLICQEIDQRLA